MQAPTGEWRSIWAGVFYGWAFTLLMLLFLHEYGTKIVYMSCVRCQLPAVLKNCKLLISCHDSFYFMLLVYPPKPRTITREWQEATVEKMIQARQQPVTGVSSLWDYEKGQWK